MKPPRIAIAERAGSPQGAARQQAEIGLQRVVKFDAGLDVELLPVDVRAAVFTAACINLATAEV